MLSKREGKRGQGLSINAIILIILGIIVLVVLIIGFTLGWDKVAPWFKPSNNVDEIAQACQVACSTNKVYDFCTMKRELKTETETFKDVTCYYLSQQASSYGISQCGSITCNVVFSSDNCQPGKALQTFDESTKTLLHSTCG